MEIPKLDRRDRHDILEKLRALASSYVPEWRWDDKQPDVGVILAHIYAAMMENTISKYNRSMYNHYLTFLNLLGTRLMPPSPAEGMVTVSMIPGAEGTYVNKGAQVYAAAGTQSGRVFYETTEAVYALDTEVDRIFFTSAKRDSIVCAYERGMDSSGVRLFGFDVYPELQRHILYFRDDDLFYTKEHTDVTVSITHSRSAKHSAFLADFFSDPEAVTWEYYGGESWRPVDRVARLENGLRLEAAEGSHPLVKEDGEELGLIRCRLSRIPEAGLYLTDVSWTAEGAGLEADALSGSTSELPPERFSPFGDIITIFSDFNISNREAFSKAGAVIDIDFEMDFFKTPIEAVAMPDTTHYRSIMTQDDFVTVRERDVLIERVLWEYWNGLGWARLFPTGWYEDFFTPKKDGSTRRRLTFRCPADMEDLVLGASSGPFIRARIDKLSYMTLMAGNYISPFVRSMTINYHYEQNSPVVCRDIWVESNVECHRRPLPDSGVDPFITASLSPDPAMYLCLTGPLTGGPLRIFWDIRDGVFPDAPSLKWEYYGLSANGTPGWKSIEVMDLTENLTRSDIVTLVGKKDFVRAGFFGAEGYFVRLVDSARRYDTADWRKNPVVRGIWPNTVPVIQRERRMPEYFFIERGQQNKRCTLSSANLSSVRVWVNEQDTLSVREEERFLSDPEVMTERNAEGAITDLWVPWQEVDRLEAAGGDDRVFLVDYAEGTVIFGDGRHGRIPPDRANESIRIEYVVCDGAYGNVPPRAILGFATKPLGVAGVTNYKRIGGGADMETIDQAADRTAGQLLGMGRIVTQEDFKRAVLASNRSIHRVKCVPHVDRYNRAAEGRLAVAVLPKEYRQGSELFSALSRNARDHIAEKASLLLTDRTLVDVFEVRYVELCAAVEVVISDYNVYHEVHQAISRKLAEFLDPITGNTNRQGWDIGQIPSRELVYNSIKSVGQIRRIKALHMFAYMVTESGRQAVEFAQVRQDAFAVPVFGEPEITLTVE